MTETELADLSQLHAEWEDALAAMIARGVPPRDAVESMTTIAVTGKMRVEGPIAASASLVLIAHMMTAAVQRQEAEDAAPRH